MAIASGSMTWYPELVCRSRLDRKHDCDGCVWIHPQTSKSLLSQKSKSALSPSSVVSQVSEVDVWSGTMRWVMKRAFETRVAQRIPQVSRLRAVLGWARLRKVVRRSGGRRTVRRGAPDSVKAVGLKVYFEGG